MDVAGVSQAGQKIITSISTGILWTGTVGVLGAAIAARAITTVMGGIFSGVGDPLVASVREALLKIARMLKALPNDVGGKMSADVTAAAGARASGGPVGPGMWLVGEKGPEMLESWGWPTREHYPEQQNRRQPWGWRQHDSYSAACCKRGPRRT
jgi:hypothetical protein